MIKLIITAFFLLFLQACATVEKSVLDPVVMYKRGMGEGSKAIIEEVRKNLKEKNAYGSVEPYDPVRLSPEIRKVWIVDHPNEAGDLIQGHWVFMVVTPGKWASLSIPAVHPENGERTTNAIPVIEEKPAASQAGGQGKMNAPQSE